MREGGREGRWRERGGGEKQEGETEPHGGKEGDGGREGQRERLTGSG